MSGAKVGRAETPLMSQYNQIKSQYPEALLLFRVGDFYETFGEDAIKTSKALGIVLTRRANGNASHIELAGFPHHSMDTYLPRLVRAGYRVAICDQLEDPKTTKTLVKRGITEMVSPGVTLMPGILEDQNSNYLASVYFQGSKLGVAFLDISTGEFRIAENDIIHIHRLIQSFNPSEILYPKSQIQEFEKMGIHFKRVSSMDNWNFDLEHSRDILLNQFQVHSLQGFGIQDSALGIRSAGACLQYLKDSRQGNLPHIVRIEKIEQNEFLYMDAFTQKNLEIIHKLHENSKTLFEVMNQTKTPMGARLLKNWLILPLKDLKMIQERQELVGFFLENPIWTEKLRNFLQDIGDLERLISRLALLKASPREHWTLFRSLEAIHKIQSLYSELENPILDSTRFKWNSMNDLLKLIQETLHPEAPVLLSRGNVIAPGGNEELDALREIAFGGKDFLLDLQKREQEKTGISSLKISFNSVFGYYFEVTHAHVDKIPADWIRKQTLVNAERYISSELKTYEEKILGAEDKIAILESRLFREFQEKILGYISPLQKNAHLIAYLDVLSNFAEIAEKKSYQQPEIVKGHRLKISEGRHPVIEECLPLGEKYISNDLNLDPEDHQILMITGPNMAGKSAILRQSALIVIMAQMGSYVPAKKVEMGLIDKVFTRVGASDNISSGQSTFMVEMIETASILNNLSPGSLILLDEIGRGTSTYDGISIAWSIAEYLHNGSGFKPKTLFATHYHELNEMEKFYPRIRNFSISVKDTGDRVIFLRKLIEGGSEHSFGIQVAKMAGIPPWVVSRARELLEKMEKGESPWSQLGAQPGADPEKYGSDPKLVMNFKDPRNSKENQFLAAESNLIYMKEIEKELRELKLDHITPMEALMILSDLKKKIGD